MERLYVSIIQLQSGGVPRKFIGIKTSAASADYINLHHSNAALLIESCGWSRKYLHCRLRNGEVTAIEKNGLMLGLFPEADYVTAVHPLKGGDRFLLYTDGIVEAFNLHGDEFGQDNLCLPALGSAICVVLHVFCVAPSIPFL